MTPLPRVVKLSTSQVRQLLRMKSQAPEVEVVTKISAKEKKNAEPITEDKKAEQKNDEKKSTARKKIKMRKRRQREKEEVKSLGSLAKMKKTTEMNHLQ